MPKFRKKPEEIEAVIFTGSNYEEIRDFIGKDTFYSDLCIAIPTLEGIKVATIGDYIIKGARGEFYLCNQKIFDETYEVVSEA
ncbi:hypothetical protein V9Z57_08185 [Streptococcus suis]|uniref:hypothetical protein n=1 Tax=Streptococcus suis TaxID=1307 RepID=UPI000CF5D465|nr:hypothetical protein [Streptococcus suis]MCO8189639.1 hypothetical protein [Streptococcus suis]HEM3501203.1 hypothetical protein [Streptococcus suis]HEM6492488.1 hypothetical protein [Streptococcus suis]